MDLASAAASKSRSLNLAAFAQTLPGPPLNSVKAVQRMTPPWVRAVRFQRSCDGKQPGDPAKAAAVLLHVASLSEPPLRLCSEAILRSSREERSW